MRRFLLLLCLPLLCACNATTVMERQVYPICLSVDATEDGGFRVGMQAPRANTGDTVEYEILSASADTFDGALRLLAASVPYPINLSQVRLCVIGYRLAATTPLRPLLRTLQELPTMRPSATVSIALGTALDVFSHQQADFGMRLSTHLSLLFSRARARRLLPDGELCYLVRELGDSACDPLVGLCAVNPRLLPQDDAPAFAMGEPRGDDPLPAGFVAGLIPHDSRNPVEYLGAAVLSEGRVSGVLSADETQLLLSLECEAVRRVAREGEQLQLQLHLPPDSPLLSQSDAIRRLMEKLQALRGDPLHFGCACSMGFSTDEAWRRYGYRGRYPTASVWVGAD